ncbi:MAG: carbohydrate kinase family protein [Clostridia bacterium]|nr:carbohydrate kinase family protein [Clostridia bacterium]
MERKYDILSAGLLVYDIIVSPVSAEIFSGDTQKIDNIAFSVGGDAMNVAADCAKLGLKTALSGTVGRDAPGDYLVSAAKKLGVDCAAVGVSDTLATSCSVVLGEADGQRHFAYYGKSNYTYDGSPITDGMLADTRLLYIGSALGLPSLGDKTLADLFKRAKAAGCLTAMDATASFDDLWLTHIEEALPYCDIFIPSYEEAVKITGETDPAATVAFLKARGVGTAGVKLGKQGVIVEDIECPAFRCDNVAGTTGAGDGFMAGFVCGTVKGLTLEERVLLGSAVSNCVIRAPGATDGVESYEKCLAVIEDHKADRLR